MAKRREGSLPTIQNTLEEGDEGLYPGIPTLEIELPLGPPPAAGSPDSYITNRVDIDLTLLQKVGLNRLWRGLRKVDARLASKRLVNSPADAVRWLLEQVGAAQ